jgi:hypothetical protein
MAGPRVHGTWSRRVSDLYRFARGYEEDFRSRHVDSVTVTGVDPKTEQNPSPNGP